jgi:hypothetical protein
MEMFDDLYYEGVCTITNDDNLAKKYKKFHGNNELFIYFSSSDFCDNFKEVIPLSKDYKLNKKEGTINTICDIIEKNELTEIRNIYTKIEGDVINFIAQYDNNYVCFNKSYNVDLKISLLCFTSLPCQHYIIYEGKKTMEACPEIKKILKKHNIYYKHISEGPDYPTFDKDSVIAKSNEADNKKIKTKVCCIL